MRSTTEIQTVSHSKSPDSQPYPFLIPSCAVIEENGVRLRLNIVDTPGYGDQVNNDRCWDPIVKYIKDQHSAYLRKELTAQRERYIQDTRIHCCLFFIQPSGHAYGCRLTPLLPPPPVANWLSAGLNPSISWS